jgi:hypothetical protein
MFIAVLLVELVPVDQAKILLAEIFTELSLEILLFLLVFLI